MPQTSRRQWRNSVLTCALLAAALPALARVVAGPPGADIQVEWKASVDEPARLRAETQLRLTDPRKLADTYTWRYDLVDTSSESIRAVVQHPAVEDTQEIERNTFTLEPTAPRTPRRQRFDAGDLLVSTADALALVLLAAAIIAATGRSLIAFLQRGIPQLKARTAGLFRLVFDGSSQQPEARPRRIRRLCVAVVALLLFSAAAFYQVRRWMDAGAALATNYLADVRLEEGVRGRLTEAYIRVRGEMYFRELARRITQDVSTDREAIDRILEWTYLHIRPASWAAPSRVQDDDPYRRVKRAFGFCDQSAQAFAILAREAGISARIYFLLNDKGQSPHTVAQVFLGGRWVLVDTLAGRVLEVDGIPLTIDDLREDPRRLDVAYAGMGRRLTVSVDDFVRGYLPHGDDVPWRWGSDSLGSDSELGTDQERESVRLYDAFREAALREGWDRVEALHGELRTHPLPRELREALGYHVTLAAYDAGEWLAATKYARAALGEDRESPWRPSLYELLGLSYERLGSATEALEAYAAADLPSTLRRSQALRTSATWAIQ